MMKHARGLAAGFGFLSLSLLLCLCACQSAPPAPIVAASFPPPKLAEMDAVVNQAIADKRCPGAVLWCEHRGVTYHKAYGHRALVPVEEPLTADTIFDPASLAKG